VCKCVYHCKLEQVERTVKRELGGTISELFAEFDEHAVAAASLAQVRYMTVTLLTVTDSFIYIYIYTSLSYSS
jgi:ABC1 atypical kinase-like domain